jgi:hypothetical protein
MHDERVRAVQQDVVAVARIKCHQRFATIKLPRPSRENVSKLEDRVVGNGIEIMVAIDPTGQTPPDDIEERVERREGLVLGVGHGRFPKLSCREIQAAQLAKASGAEVTAVVATRHLDLVKSLGADRAIDYTAEDFTRIGETFDFIFEAVGKASFFRCRKLLTPEGTFMATDIGPWGQYLPLIVWSSIVKNNKVLVPLPPRGSGHAFVEYLKGRMEAGQFRAVIDRRYPLDAIADAYRYVETGQKTGIVVIIVAAADESAHTAQNSRTGTGPSFRSSEGTTSATFSVTEQLRVFSPGHRPPG